MAMSALPSMALIGKWNDEETPASIGTVLTWAHVTGPLEQAFLKAVECDATEPYRSLSLLTEQDAEDLPKKIKIGENDLGPLQAANIRLVFAAVWHAGAGGALPQQAKDQAGPPLPNYPPPATLTPDMPDVIALNGLVMQTGSILTRLIPQAEYDEMFRTYRKRCGADMAQDVEPTRAQVSAYLALVKERATIAVDFAVWKPNADRNEKLRAMEGVRFTLDGKIVSLVTYGPGNIHEWQ